MSVWLTANSAEGNAYRLKNASFRVSVVTGSEVATVTSDDVTEPPPESIDLPVDPGAYGVELLQGWRLYRVEPGNDVPVQAELVSEPTVFVNVVSGETASVIYTFQTDGGIVQTGPGDIGISIQIEETQCLGNPCNDENECTQDFCDSVTQECSNPPVANGTQCVAVMDPGTCQDGVCVGLCEGVDCSSNNQCVVEGQCDPSTGLCLTGADRPVNTSCDQNGGAYCDGAGACVECTSDGQCRGLNPIDPCVDVSCVAGQCQSTFNQGANCDFLPGVAGVCRSGVCEDAGLCEGVVCEDLGRCTQEYCDQQTGDCVVEPLPDGAFCPDGTCYAGECTNRFPCTEEGIRNAIATGGGPLNFDCPAGDTNVITSAEIVIDKDVILSAAGRLRVNGNDSHRVFAVNEGVTATLAGMSITNGFAPSSDTTGGGCIRNEGTLTLADVTLTECEARNGGAIHNRGVLALNAVTAINNTATESGGAIFNQGTVTTPASEPVQPWLTASDNTAETYGGALRNLGQVTIYDAVITGNQVTGNPSVYGQGGGVHNSSTGTLTLARSTIDDNTASRSGGGVDNFGTMEIANSTISRNFATADQGGGIYNGGGSLRIDNSTIYGNLAGTAGGGLSNAGGTTLWYVTFAQNVSTSGANALQIDSAVQLTGSLVGGSCAGSSNISGNSFYNVFAESTCLSLHVSPGNTNVIASSLFDPEPALLGDNGGPTLTVLPAATVPPSDYVIDVSLGCGEVGAVDQRGEPRLLGTRCDAGAVERQ